MKAFNHSIRQTCCVVLCAALVGATGPAASLKGTKVKVDGVQVPTANEVAGWPVGTGQEISSGTESATLVLPDGNKVLMQPNTIARLMPREKGATLELQSGSVSLDIKDPESFGLRVKDRVLTAGSAMRSDVTLRKDNSILVARHNGRVLVDGEEAEPLPGPAPAPQAQAGGAAGGGAAAASSISPWVFVVIGGAAAAGVATAIAVTGDDEEPVSPSTP